MKLFSISITARVLAFSMLLVSGSACSVSEQVKESPSKRSSGINGGTGQTELAENQAYEQMQFRLNFMDEARLAGQDILFVRQADDLTSAQQVKLQTALKTGMLPLRLRLRIFARNPSPLTFQLKKLDYQLLLDGRELAAGITGVGTELEASAIVTLPVAVDLNVPQNRISGSTPAAFAVNLADFTGTTRRLTVRIRPTFVSATGRVYQPAEFQPILLVTAKTVKIAAR